MQTLTVTHKGTSLGNVDLIKSSHCPDERAKEPEDKALEVTLQVRGRAGLRRQVCCSPACASSQAGFQDGSRGILERLLQGRVITGKLSLYGWQWPLQVGSPTVSKSKTGPKKLVAKGAALCPVASLSPTRFSTFGQPHSTVLWIQGDGGGERTQGMQGL